MNLVTRCPFCDTSFRVTEEQLAAASGSVRCGACLAVFSAPDHLIDEADAPHDAAPWLDDGTAPDDARDAEIPEDELPEDGIPEDSYDDALWQAAGTAAVTAETAWEDDEPDPWHPVDSAVTGEWSAEAPGSDEEEANTDGAAMDTGDVEETEAEEYGRFEGELDVETPVDEVVGEYVPEVPHHYVAWTAGSLVLVAALALQLAWFNRNTYAQDSRFRGYYESVCRIAGCDLPVYADPAALHVAHLVVRTHPTVAKALEVDAIIRNDAPWPQYFPDLTLRFSDIHGMPVAARTFTPADYLGGEMTGVKFIPARTDVHISLGIVDPGPAAINYALTIVR